MSFSPLPASQAKNISLRVVLPASYIMYQDINHVATRHQSLQPVAFPGGAVLNKKLALSLGEKKNVERTQNFPVGLYLQSSIGTS